MQPATASAPHVRYRLERTSPDPVVAIVCIGPKDLPIVLRTLGKMARKARGLAREFQASVEEVIRETELSEARKEIDSAKRLVSLEDTPTIGEQKPVASSSPAASAVMPEPPGDPKP